MTWAACLVVTWDTSWTDGKENTGGTSHVRLVDLDGAADVKLTV